MAPTSCAPLGTRARAPPRGTGAAPLAANPFGAIDDAAAENNNNSNFNSSSNRFNINRSSRTTTKGTSGSPAVTRMLGGGGGGHLLYDTSMLGQKPPDPHVPASSGGHVLPLIIDLSVREAIVASGHGGVYHSKISLLSKVCYRLGCSTPLTPAYDWTLPLILHEMLLEKMLIARASCRNSDPKFVEPRGAPACDVLVAWIKQLMGGAQKLAYSARKALRCVPGHATERDARQGRLVVRLLAAALDIAVSMMCTAEPHPGFSRPSRSNMGAAKWDLNEQVRAGWTPLGGLKRASWGGPTVVPGRPSLPPSSPLPAQIYWAVDASDALSGHEREALFDALAPKAAHVIVGGLYGMVAEASTRELLRVELGPTAVVGAPPDTSKVYEDVLPGVHVRIKGKPDAAVKPAAGGATGWRLMAAAGGDEASHRMYPVEIKNHVFCNGEAPSHSEVSQACLYGNAENAPAVLVIDRGGLKGLGAGNPPFVAKTTGFKRRGAVVWPSAINGGAGSRMVMFVFSLAYSYYLVQVSAVTEGLGGCGGGHSRLSSRSRH